MFFFYFYYLSTLLFLYYFRLFLKPHFAFGKGKVFSSTLFDLALIFFFSFFFSIRLLQGLRGKIIDC